MSYYNNYNNYNPVTHVRYLLFCALYFSIISPRFQAFDLWRHRTPTSHVENMWRTLDHPRDEKRAVMVATFHPRYWCPGMREWLAEQSVLWKDEATRPAYFTKEFVDTLSRSMLPEDMSDQVFTWVDTDDKNNLDTGNHAQKKTHLRAALQDVGQSD